MNPIVKNILAVIAGVVGGGILNMGIVMLGGELFPAPEGVDPNDMESIAANIHLYQPQHFVPPFLAHALGTLFGAFLAAKIAATRKMTFALAMGAWFMLGGLAAAFMIPAPTWFIVLDLAIAYIPMGYLGGKLAGAK